MRIVRPKWLFCTAACFLLFLTSYRTNPAGSQRKIRTIVIDAGHGGRDGGSSGVRNKEKDIALKVALGLGKALEEKMPDVKVVYTRTTDVFIDLYDRIGLANRIKADIFISIHCNSLPLNKPGRASFRGAETLLSGSGRLGEQDVALRENASLLLEKDYKENYDGFDPRDPQSYIILSLMKNNFRKQSINLGVLIQDQFRQSGRIDRGVREQSLAVLARAGMPAVLCEIGYISSPEEENYMSSESGQKELVANLLNGLQQYKIQSEQYRTD
ncbi:N-acetylmuramoyl-L-alanine amidase family protein [Hufsiella ginkgonis]|uniref:N-acetylmuramoyl-L-alanine amidase n=1 Tax=Hufsiella ginkgonis TaxID=2695274 RepID=A0A7K1XZS3_9SPHI|nr:N-acetylmuramoyl-L-alanine amidase [Hufsiella ginkgonis]MXV16229.1 N-acetylmuramoyl-L-alanine amidase [Hufsiella ginkgonis]